MNIEKDQVYTFKLNSGEELVGRVKEVTAEVVSIQEPVSVAPSAKGMGLVPSLFTSADAPVQLRLNSVSLVAHTDDSVKDRYLEAITGIRVPSKQILV